MTAQVIAFPRTAVVRSVAETKPKPRRRTRPKSPPVKVPDGLEAALSQMCKQMRADDAEREAGFNRWASGERKPLQWFAENSIQGLATETFGEGPDYYRRAHALAGTPIHPDNVTEALALAIDTLNALAFLVRYGGLRARECMGDAKREDRLAHAECARGVVSDLGAAMTRLRAFGAIAGPTAAERRRNAQRQKGMDQGSTEGATHA